MFLCVLISSLYTCVCVSDVHRNLYILGIDEVGQSVIFGQLYILSHCVQTGITRTQLNRILPKIFVRIFLFSLRQLVSQCRQNENYLHGIE